MRISGSRGTPGRSNGRKLSEPRDAAGPLESGSPESLDDEIRSLLASLDQTAEDSGPATRDTPIRASRRPREFRSARWQGSRLASVDRFDLVLIVLAVGLGFAVGLTVFLLNG
jgi:hypothetical protein